VRGAAGGFDLHQAGLPPAKRSVCRVVNLQAFPSLKHLFERGFERFRDLPAVSSLGVTLSYGELERLSRDFAAFLAGDLGLARGERAGLAVVNVNPLYTPKSPLGKVLHRELKPSK
jgi:acyl-CoA synthetase (AMP-forming)/AMP-acid ligase II